MLTLQQQDIILRRLANKLTIFKITDESNICGKAYKSREVIHRQLLSHLQKTLTVTHNDPLQYGQIELKNVMALLEEQLTAKVTSNYVHSGEELKKVKKLVKFDQKLEEADDNPTKKQRVDKNKCRVCKNSTIPTILDILQQDQGQDPTQHITMKSIRQTIVQKQKREEQSDSKIPYIPFDYSLKIVICKRCRFKFHSECVENADNQNDWICDYCHLRIDELKCINQWDYVNNKQLKSDQKKPPTLLMDRIGKKQQIFVIEDYAQSPVRQIDYIAEFLDKYPHYDQGNGTIQYPISELLAKDHPFVLAAKQKPKPYMINSELVEQILKIQTTVQILFPKLPTPQTVNKDYIERNFYDLLLNYISIYIEEIYHDTTKFMLFESQLDAVSSLFFQLLEFLIKNKNEDTEERDNLRNNFFRTKYQTSLISKLWMEIVRHLAFIIDSPPCITDPQQLTFKEEIAILAYLVDGLYDLDKMKKAIDQKELQASQQMKSSQFKPLAHNFPLALVNCACHLGQDIEESHYYYFTHVPSSIFVQSAQGWGQYTLSDLNDILASLNTQGVNELNLYESLSILQQVKLLENTTPIKQFPRKTTRTSFYVDAKDLIIFILKLEAKVTTFLETLNKYWINEDEHVKFIDRVKSADNIIDIISTVRFLIQGLVYITSKTGNECKPFKLFKQQQSISQQLFIYTQQITSREGAYMALLCLETILDQYIVYKENKPKSLVAQQHKRGRKPKPIVPEVAPIDIPQGLAVRREKRENAGKNPNIGFDNILDQHPKRICLKCNKQTQAKLDKCNKCSKPYHSDCMKRDVCQNCQQNRRYK